MLKQKLIILFYYKIKGVHYIKQILPISAFFLQYLTYKAASCGVMLLDLLEEKFLNSILSVIRTKSTIKEVCLIFFNLDGVLLIKNEQDTLPLIGRKYYENFGYVYNPVYNKNHFEDEFNEVLKLKNKSHTINDIKFKILSLKSDDENIYEFRKNFWNGR